MHIKESFYKMDIQLVNKSYRHPILDHWGLRTLLLKGILDLLSWPHPINQASSLLICISSPSFHDVEADFHYANLVVQMFENIYPFFKQNQLLLLDESSFKMIFFLRFFSEFNFSINWQLRLYPIQCLHTQRRKNYVDKTFFDEENTTLRIISLNNFV